MSTSNLVNFEFLVKVGTLREFKNFYIFLEMKICGVKNVYIFIEK